MDQKVNCQVSFRHKGLKRVAHPIVNISSSIEHFRPSKALRENLSYLLILPGHMSVSAEPQHPELQTYSFSRTASTTALLPALDTPNSSDNAHNSFCILAASSYLLREPRNIPSGDAPRILDHDLEVGELHHCDGVEGHVQEDEGPFEEGVDGVCWAKSVSGYSIPPTLDMTYLRPRGAPCAE